MDALTLESTLDPLMTDPFNLLHVMEALNVAHAAGDLVTATWLINRLYDMGDKLSEMGDKLAGAP